MKNPEGKMAANSAICMLFNQIYLYFKYSHKLSDQKKCTIKIQKKRNLWTAILMEFITIVTAGVNGVPLHPGAEILPWKRR
jgi:hypothetical protein